MCTCPVGATARTSECVRLPLPVPLSSTTQPARRKAARTSRAAAPANGMAQRQIITRASADHASGLLHAVAEYMV